MNILKYSNCLLNSQQANVCGHRAMDNATENENLKMMMMLLRESSPQVEKKSSEHEEEGTRFTSYVRCNQCVCIDIIEYLIDNGVSMQCQ